MNPCPAVDDQYKVSLTLLLKILCPGTYFLNTLQNLCIYFCFMVFYVIPMYANIYFFMFDCFIMFWFVYLILFYFIIIPQMPISFLMRKRMGMNQGMWEVSGRGSESENCNQNILYEIKPIFSKRKKNLMQTIFFFENM